MLNPRVRRTHHQTLPNGIYKAGAPCLEDQIMDQIERTGDGAQVLHRTRVNRSLQPRQAANRKDHGDRWAAERLEDLTLVRGTRVEIWKRPRVLLRAYVIALQGVELYSPVQTAPFTSSAPYYRSTKLCEKSSCCTSQAQSLFSGYSASRLFAY